MSGGEAHWWLLEHWWLSRPVWSLDRVHTIYSTRRKSSWRKVDEKTACIQARSFMARNLENNGKARQAEGEAKVVWWKVPSWKHSKFSRDLFLRPRGYGIQRNHQNARKKLETSVAPAMPCKIMKNGRSGGSNKINTKLACILEAN